MSIESITSHTTSIISYNSEQVISILNSIKHEKLDFELDLVSTSSSSQQQQQIDINMPARKNQSMVESSEPAKEKATRSRRTARSRSKSRTTGKSASPRGRRAKASTLAPKVYTKVKIIH